MKLLFLLYTRPSEACSAILDQGSLLFASVAVVAVSFAYRLALPMPFYLPLLVLAVFFVPGVLLLTNLLALRRRSRRFLRSRLFAAAHLRRHDVDRR